MSDLFLLLPVPLNIYLLETFSQFVYLFIYFPSLEYFRIFEFYY